MVLRPLHPSLPSGSICAEVSPQRDVRFSLISDRIADIAGGPFRAMSGSVRAQEAEIDSGIVHLGVIADVERPSRPYGARR